MTTQVYLPLMACPGGDGLGALPSPNPSPAPVPVAANAYEARIIQPVNEPRVAVGCPAATPNVVLMQATGDYNHTPSN